jgi:hypothetical protein
MTGAFANAETVPTGWLSSFETVDLAKEMPACGRPLVAMGL